MDEITLCYSGKSRITAEKIAEASGGRIRLNRGPTGDCNWGRAEANTELNPDTSKATNKKTMRELFRDNDVPMPRLYLSDPTISPPWSYPIVGRPDYHTKGRGYWLCRNEADVQKALRGTRKKKAATHFMEFIPDAVEYRVHVWLGKSIRISEKDFTNPRIVKSTYDPRTSSVKLDIGFMARKPTCDDETLKSVRRAAKKAVKALGLDFGAVDVLVNNNGVYVLEVNSAPGLGGSMPKLYADNIERWFDERD